MATEAVEQEFTEAELDGGEATPAAPVTEPVVPPAETPPAVVTEPAAPKETTPPVTPPAVVPPETPPEAAKTVPLAALHEARKDIRALRTQMEALTKKAAEGPEPKTASELVAEDPEGAVAILERKIEEMQTYIETGEIKREIDAEVPDFLELAPQMEELLLSEGMAEETGKNLIAAAGKDVAKFFKILGRIVKTPDEKSLRETLTKELTPSITAQVTKDLMVKFKITEPPKNVGKIPGAPETGQIIASGEDEFSKLTPEQQRAWLDGG